VCVVDIPAGALQLLAPSGCYHNPAAVRDTEQLFIIRINKADALLCLFNVSVQPLCLIAKAVEVVISLDGVAAQQISIFLSIRPKPVFGGVIAGKGAFWMPLLCTNPPIA
jgi:hypothetical protein